MSSINAFNVESWIGFSIAKLLRLGQYIGKRATFITHFGHDKVASTINDTC